MSPLGFDIITKPAWLNFDFGANSAKLYGTPLDIGSYPIEIQFYDGINRVSHKFEIAVLPAPIDGVIPSGAGDSNTEVSASNSVTETAPLPGTP